MGVMSCNRKGCKNVMCDRYSEKHGYICDECFDQLVNTESINISLFMKTERDEFNTLGEINYREYFSNIFKENE